MSDFINLSLMISTWNGSSNGSRPSVNLVCSVLTVQPS